MAKKPIEKFMTPFGVLQKYAYIVKPSTKFDDAGVYEFKLEFAGEDAKTMKKYIDGCMKKSLEDSGKDKAAPAPYTINKDDKTLTVKFKLKASIKTRKGDIWERSIALYGPKGGKVTKPKMYAEGTELRVNMTPYLWFAGSMGAGVTLQPLAVQFRKVVEWNPEMVNEFEAVEGYESSDVFTAADGQMEPPANSTSDDEEDEFDF